jgi:hypothetical protein
MLSLFEINGGGAGAGLLNEESRKQGTDFF